MRILIIEDNSDMLRTLEKGLMASQFLVDSEMTFKEGLKKAENSEYDLIAIDINLPEGSGLDIVKKLRDGGKEVPIIVMTIHSKVQDRVKGLNLGADDYMTKPFSINEFVARARVLTRRNKNIKSSIIKIDGLELDPIAFEVRCKNEIVNLVKKEFSLLEYLLRNKGSVISRSQLREHVWGEDTDPLNNSIEVHMVSLRKKLKEHTDREFIQTIRGLGYKIV